MEAQQQPQENQDNKVVKEFNKGMKKLVALFGGEQAFARTSVPNDGLGNVVEELLRERRQQMIDKFKEEAKIIIDKKIELDREIKKAEEELKQKITAKKKEFNEKMKTLFAMVENINTVESSYYASLSEAGSANDGDDDE